RKGDRRRAGVTADSPVPFLLYRPSLHHLMRSTPTTRRGGRAAATDPVALPEAGNDGTHARGGILMRKLLLRVGTAAFITLLGAAPVIGQTRPLAPMPSTGLAVSPFMEGWYQNPDGSRTISFGYLNRNQNDIIYLPFGDRNLLEPAEFSGMQPTVFMPGRHRGVSTVTVPAGFTEDLWWSILNEDGQVHKVPGRTSSTAYELDRNPRPTGTVPPRIGFSENGPWGVGPAGVMADQTLSARVGERVVLEVWVEEISERDPTDPRSEAAKSVRVVWFPHQAPVNGKIEFAKHESTA